VPLVHVYHDKVVASIICNILHKVFSWILKETVDEFELLHLPWGVGAESCKDKLSEALDTGELCSLDSTASTARKGLSCDPCLLICLPSDDLGVYTPDWFILVMVYEPYHFSSSLAESMSLLRLSLQVLQKNFVMNCEGVPNDIVPHIIIWALEMFSSAS
jgi:hypothetical protein